MALRPRSALRDYQLRASDILVERLPNTGGQAMLIKPGMGKTPSALDVIYRLRPRRTLVMAPAQVAAARIWSREARIWEHLCNLSVTEIVGPESKRDLYLMLGSEIEVISYENLIWLTDNIDRDRYDAVIFDELQMMKHPGTKRFKRMRAWTKSIPLKLGLTGSPLGNAYSDLWGEMRMVTGHNNPLGLTKEDYLSTYFNAIRQGDRIGYEIRQDGSVDRIRELIKPYAFSLKPQRVIDQLPKVIPVTIPLEAPQRCRDMEKKLRREFEVQLDSGMTLTALNQSKMGQAVRQFASGAIYTGETGETDKWEELHDMKLQALRNVIDELQGNPILVFVWFKHEAVRIQREFPKAVILKGQPEIVDRWNRKEIPILIVHPLGGGKGLNLQHGSSSVFWFTLPWAWDAFEQGCARLARIGQPDDYVTAHLPLCGPIDRRVWSTVTGKGQDEESLMDAVELEVS